MRFALSLIAVCGLAIMSSGCANAEKKLGRGLRNATEFARMGEMGHSIEQSYMFEDSYAVGAVRGFNRSIARTAVGVFEIVLSQFLPSQSVDTTRPLTRTLTSPTKSPLPHLKQIPALDSVVATWLHWCQEADLECLRTNFHCCSRLSWTPWGD